MAGYSGTPLVKKLGINEGCAVHTVGAPADYRNLLKPLPPGVRFEVAATVSTNIVHVFETQRTGLNTTLVTLRKKLGSRAIVWVSWPKKSSKVPTTISEDVIRELALPLGFVDVKVCAVTDVWSGLKLVVRKELR
jgi:hypothetical protein